MKKGGTNKINKRLKNKGLHLYIENEFFVKTLIIKHASMLHRQVMACKQP